MNLIPISVNVSRAWEIAQNGKFKIRLVGGEKHDGTVFPDEDIDLLKNFYGLEDTDSPDMFVEVCHDPQSILTCLETNRCETLEDINGRIFDFDINNLVVDRTLSGPCKSLLKTAIEKLELSATITFKIIDIAAVIAKMANSKILKAEHVAEAIQYHSLPKQITTAKI